MLTHKPENLENNAKWSPWKKVYNLGLCMLGNAIHIETSTYIFAMTHIVLKIKRYRKWKHASSQNVIFIFQSETY